MVGFGFRAPASGRASGSDALTGRFRFLRGLAGILLVLLLRFIGRMLRPLEFFLRLLRLLLLLGQFFLAFLETVVRLGQCVHLFLGIRGSKSRAIR